MTFEERNQAWSGPEREFRQVHSRSGTPRVWRVRVEGNRIHTSWGQLNGAMQLATEVKEGVNLGKSNEKSPEQYALERARDACRKKNWEGYREIGLLPSGAPIINHAEGTPYFLDSAVEANIDFDNLPLSLSFYKPDNSMGVAITKKAEAGKVLYARKANGMMFVIARGEGSPKIYSRRMLRQQDDEQITNLTWDNRFPHLLSEAKRLMPQNSILLGELVFFRDGVEDFSYVQSVTKSLTPQALEDQEKHGWLNFYVWDVAFWDGVNLIKEAPVKERYALIHDIIDGDGFTPIFIPVQYFPEGFFKTPQAAEEYVRARKWEGFVVVDPEGIYGDKAYNFKGKPDRPGALCAKLKPSFEDDFVAFWDPSKGWGERSTKARNDHGIKSVALYQYNKEGQLIYISNVSSGLKDEQKKTWADPARYPQVWRVSYKGRRFVSDGDDTNALDFPAFEEERSDKKPFECQNNKL